MLSVTITNPKQTEFVSVFSLTPHEMWKTSNSIPFKNAEQSQNQNCYMLLYKLSRFIKFKAMGYIYVLILCKVKAIYLSCVNLHSKQMKHKDTT